MPRFYVVAISMIGQVKSSVDDLTLERGTVRMKVVFVLRSAEVQPLFCDLFVSSSSPDELFAMEFDGGLQKYYLTINRGGMEDLRCGRGGM
jgi:hypothetical protein